MNDRKAAILLRLGLASVFLYAAISGFLFPYNWVGYLPDFLKIFASPFALLKLFSAGEIVLGFWLLSGWKAKWSAAVSCLLLLGITFSNIAVLDVTFRDVGLAFAAAALFLIEG